MVFKENG